MKASRRNINNLRARAERLSGGPPAVSKYSAKQRGIVAPTGELGRLIEEALAAKGDDQ